MKLKTMKKMMAVMMCTLLMFGLAACGNERQETSSEEETKNQSGADENVSNAANTENMESESKKTLVVYYSASGNTKEAAEYIAAATGGDLFELEPEEPYTDDDLDWTDDDSRVSREYENEEERNVALVSTEVPGWESYETVYVGYAGGIIGLN